MSKGLRIEKWNGQYRIVHEASGYVVTRSESFSHPYLGPMQVDTPGFRTKREAVAHAESLDPEDVALRVKKTRERQRWAAHHCNGCHSGNRAVRGLVRPLDRPARELGPNDWIPCGHPWHEERS